MALIDSFPGASGTVDSTELRKNLAGLIVRDTSGNPRAGIFPRHTNALVTSRADMKLDIAAFEGVSVRGGGPLFMANDGVVQSPALAAAPASNSRIDVLYFKQNESVAPYADADNLPLFGVVTGTAAASPTKPSIAGIAGATELATITVPSTATATNSGGVVITQTFQYTTLTGGYIPFRTAAERDLFTMATPGQHASVFADPSPANNCDSKWMGAAWASNVPLSATGGASIGTAEVVVPSCSLTLAPGNWDVIASAYMDWSTSGGTTPVHVLRLRSGGLAGTEVDQKRININGHVGQIPVSLQAQLVLTVSTVVVLTGVSTGPGAGTTLVQNARIRATPAV